MSNESLIRHLSECEVVDHLASEQVQKDRFPCRFVFVSTYQRYKSVVEALRTRAQTVLRLSDDAYCRGEDVVPVFSRIVNSVRDGGDGAFLLEGFGEYLRLIEGNRSLGLDVISLLNLECHSTKRVWIPVFQAKSILFKIVGELNHRYDNALFEVEGDDDSSAFRLSVYPQTMSAVLGSAAIPGIRSWLKRWEDLTISSGEILATRNVDLFSAVDGAYSVRVVKSPFAYIKDSLQDAGSLDESMGDVTKWGWLASKINQSTRTLEGLIKDVLNVAHFNAIDVLSRWDKYEGCDAHNEHWLIWLWYHRSACAGGDYFSYAIGKAKRPEDIPLQIEIAILDDSFKNNVDDAREQRRLVVRRLCAEKRSKEFWAGFDSISDDYQKLKILTADTKEERVRIIKTAGGMLQRGEKLQDVLLVLEIVYPELAYYLSHSGAAGEFEKYFGEYKSQKVRDVFDTEIEDMFSKSQLLAVQARNAALKEFRAEGDFVLCVDGMGVEWSDLLIWEISRINKDVTHRVEVAAALLPTETAANHFWDTWDKSLWKKDDRLDAKSHIKDRSDGIDHNALTELQFEIIHKIASDIVELVQERGRIIVTADHGLSRLAAIHFNNLTGTSLPPAAVPNGVQSCRYCQVEHSYHIMSEMYMRHQDLLIMATHNHFKVGGWIPGETHGGMTPEEYLVPVLEFSLKKSQGGKMKLPAYKLLETKVRLQGMVARFVVESAGLTSLRAEANNESVKGRSVGGDRWEVSFETLRAGQTYQLSVYPNNLASGRKEEVEILRRGLVVEDDF